jgi:hypothetical protein
MTEDRYKLGAKATGEGYERLRRALEAQEGGFDPGAVQRSTHAIGLYQFVPRWWDENVKKMTGRSLASFLPENDTPEAMAKSTKDQREILFPKYYEKELAPGIKALRNAGLGKGLTDIEIAGMIQLGGLGATRTYLKTGWDKTTGTADNPLGLLGYARLLRKKAEGIDITAPEAAPVISQWHKDKGEFEADNAIREANKKKGKHQTREELDAGVTYKHQHQKPQKMPAAPGVPGHQPTTSLAGTASASPALGDNETTLKELQTLHQQLARIIQSQDALHRISAEGGGHVL